MYSRILVCRSVSCSVNFVLQEVVFQDVGGTLMPMLAPGASRCKPLFDALTTDRPFATVGGEQMYATRPAPRLHSDQALRRLYRWALVLVAALAVMLALRRVAQGRGAGGPGGGH